MLLEYDSYFNNFIPSTFHFQLEMLTSPLKGN